jgi:hypothetical protein
MANSFLKALGSTTASVVKAGTGIDLNESLGKQFLNLADAATTADHIRDQRHAQRMFGDNNYALAPKHGALFHVNIEINPALNPFSNEQNIELGMLAKNVTLPSFNYDTETLHAYNRKVNVQTKLNYSPITIEFHDDTLNVVKNFHELYLKHYFRDMDHENPMYDPKYAVYNNRTTKDWGYTQASDGHFISRIHVYSFSQKNFTHYVIENPLIQSFNHGKHDYSGENFLSSTMTVVPEAVRYIGEGTVSSDQVRGFGIIHYDTTPSPLQALGGRDTIIGKGGLFNTIGGIGDQISKGNFLGAALNAFRARETFKNADLKKTALRDITTVATDVVRGNNTQGKFFFPTVGNLVNKFGTSQAKTVSSAPITSDVTSSSIASRNVANTNNTIVNKNTQETLVSQVNLGQSINSIPTSGRTG